MSERLPPGAAAAAGAMWGRLGAVAGGVRSLAAELAAEVIETAEDLAHEVGVERGQGGANARGIRFGVGRSPRQSPPLSSRP